MGNGNFKFGDRDADNSSLHDTEVSKFAERLAKPGSRLAPEIRGRVGHAGRAQSQHREERSNARKQVGRIAAWTSALVCFGALHPLTSATPDDTLQFSQHPIEIATVPLGASFESNETVQDVVSHRVRAGETLWQLSRHYGVDVDAIASANNLNRNVKLKAGQVLYILRTQGRVHVVSKGDTLNSISRRYGISVSDILRASPDVSPNKIEVGQRLTVPNVRPSAAPIQIAARPAAPIPALPSRTIVSRSAAASTAPAPIQGNIKTPASVSPELASKTLPYQAKAGDTLDGLARRYGISKQSIQRANPGTTLNSIQSGQKMRLPRMPGVLMHEDYSPGQENQLALLTPPPSLSRPQYPSGFVRPVTGPITSGYGWRWGRMHHGLDFGGPVGSPISSVMSGEVIFAGWDRGGYGNRVDIRHPNGMVTRYAHGHKIYVKRGQRVMQGDVIMTRGSTGRSTGPHLHFEVRYNNRSYNPLKFLA
ncbi:MAG: LysM peptidoglycan-binding domain-containing M23 family metallopeptidase [Cyanobacteria bacterium P01_D01_bin.123]